MVARRSSGFTLMELVVALFVVALLLGLALPGYQQQLRSTRRALAVAVLLEATMRQEQYFLAHKRYAVTLLELDYPAESFAIDLRGNPVNPGASGVAYRIELAGDLHAYTLSATPEREQAADRVCGTLSVGSTGMKRVSGSGAVRECW